MRRRFANKLTDLVEEIQKLSEEKQIEALRMLIGHVAAAKGRETRHLCYQIINAPPREARLVPLSSENKGA